MGRAFEFRKDRKMRRWAAMSKTFTKIGKEILMAVKENGPHPETNSKLRAIIQNAKTANMPKENIERAIKKASEKDNANLTKTLFEGYAPHGIAILIETTTDNNNRTVANIRSYFNKYNGSLSTSGSVEFLFDHKCYFLIKHVNQNLENLELDLIDFGAEELFVEEEGIYIFADFLSFGKIQKKLENLKECILKSGFDRIPNVYKKIEENQEKDVYKLIEKIEEDEDVQNIFHNIK